MIKHPVATSLNGQLVYANLVQSTLAARVSRNPHLVTLIRDVITTLDLLTSTVTIEQDMGKTLGYSDHLETKDHDSIFYARTSKLPEYTRFVKRRSAEQTTYLTFQLEQDSNGDYELVDAWLGQTYPPAPSQTNDTKQSKDYWATHAVVFNGQSLMGGTITTVCPY